MNQRKLFELIHICEGCRKHSLKPLCSECTRVAIERVLEAIRNA